MRLNRVLALHDGGSWFHSRYWRINPPEGHVQHWTRPLDALLLAGAWLLEPVLGFRQGLHVWGVLFSPVCLALSCWRCRLGRAAGARSRRAPVRLSHAYLMQPTIMAYSSLGRPDHHAPLLLLFVVLLGLTLRLFADPHGRRLAEAAGLVAALAIWLSPEALAFIAPSLASVGLVWLLGEAAMAAAIRRYLVALTLASPRPCWSSAGRMGSGERERSPLVDPSQPVRRARAGLDPDRGRGAQASCVGRSPAGLVGCAVDSGHPRSAGWPALIGRAGVAAVGTLGVGLALIALFPELRAGPLGQVDPLYAEVRLHRILEIQPLLSAGWLDRELGPQLHRVFRLIGLAWLAVPFLVFLLIREHGDQRKKMWACIALTLATLLALTFYQVRWAIYTQALLVLPYSALLGSLLRRAAVRVSPRAVPFCRAPLIVAGLLWPLLPALLLPRARVEIAGQSCPIARIAPALEQAVGPAPRTIMAFADFGPEILYRTGYSVLSIPNHRPQPGFAATYRALTARADADARAILEDYRVDLILLCPSEVERSIFTPPDGGSGHLYERVVDGTPPGWLREVTLEAEEGPALNARILQVLPGPTLVQRSGGARF